MDASHPDSVALFRFERVLSGSRWVDPTLAAAAWMAAGQQQVASRLTRLGAVAAAGLLSAPTPAQDRTTAVRMAWLALRGASEDRLAVLGEEYAHDKLIPSLNDAGMRLVSEARRRGLKLVVLTELIDVIAEHLAAHLGAELLVCNRMTIRNGVATGSLEGDVFAGVFGGARAREFASEHGVDLDRSLAWGGCSTDATLLNTVGEPCAVHPDPALRRLARDLDWPVVEAP